MRRALSCTATLLSLLLCAGSAAAGELYVSGLVGISGGAGKVSGENTFVNFEIGGDDVDSSPAYGGALGFQFLLGDVITRDVRLPEVVPWKLRLPNFNVRLEVEGVAGRDYELKTEGFTSSIPYHTEVESWAIMVNNWLEMPVHPAVNAAFGRRFPGIEPLSIYFGGGVGYTKTSVATSDSLVSGSSKAGGFAYQFGAGISYDVTPRFQIAAGYRRVEMGSVKLDLVDASGTQRGDFKLDLYSNEAVITMKTSFFTIPWPHRSTARRYDW